MHVMYMCMCMYLSSGLQVGNKCSVVKAEATSCPCPGGWAREQADTLSHVDTHTLILDIKSLFQCTCSTLRGEGEGTCSTRPEQYQGLSKVNAMPQNGKTNKQLYALFLTQVSSSLSTIISLYGGQRNRRSRQGPWYHMALSMTGYSTLCIKRSPMHRLGAQCLALQDVLPEAHILYLECQHCRPVCVCVSTRAGAPHTPSHPHMEREYTLVQTCMASMSSKTSVEKCVL